MPGAVQHLTTGVVAAAAVNASIQLAAISANESIAFDWGQFSACCLLGGTAALLPDILEPADSPNHRKFCHSLVAALVVAYLMSGKHVKDLPPEIRSLVTALGVGYLSHLCLDAGTPRCIPVVWESRAIRKGTTVTLKKHRHKNDKLKTEQSAATIVEPGDKAHTDAKHEDFLKERDVLCQASLETSGRFDKYLITLASGTLVMSLGFVEKVAAHPAPETKIWILATWISLVICLVCGVAALLGAQYAVLREIKNLNTRYQASQTQAIEGDLPNNWIKFVHAANVGALICWTIGISSFCKFASKNFPSTNSSPPSAQVAATPMTNDVPKPKSP